jgi:hypothetical protein
LCEAWLAGADLCVIDRIGTCIYGTAGVVACFKPENMGIHPNSILPDERKERIKQQLLKIDADKLAQLIIDSGIEL